MLYGCGDFLNDYEGIGGYEDYRDDLGLMYFASMDPSTGKLVELQMTRSDQIFQGESSIKGRRALAGRYSK